MPNYNPKGLVMKMVALVLELDKYKKAYENMKAENEFLKSLIQTKLPFEART